jgi:hypothetical protein
MWNFLSSVSCPEIFRGFFHSVQANFCILLQIRPRYFFHIFSTSVPLIILPFDMTQSALLVHLAVCLRQDHGEFSTKCDLVLPPSASSTLSLLRSSSRCSRLLPFLPLTSIPPSTFPLIMWFSREFLRKMWPIQLPFILFDTSLLIPMAGRSKASVCGRQLAGIAVWNPAGAGTFVSCECCV